ncbi:hypothetical protein ABIB62_003146 [Mucilaginibacter sp. UYP25]
MVGAGWVGTKGTLLLIALYVWVFYKEILIGQR